MRRLGLPQNLERMRSSTNLSEHLFGRVRAIGRRVKRWPNGTMAVRHSAYHDIGQLNSALTMSIGSAKAAGLSYEDLVASISAFCAVGMQGTEAGTAMEESLQAFARGKLDKIGVPLATFNNGALDVIGTFANFRQAFGTGAISLTKFQEAAKALGIRGERALAINVPDLLKFQKCLNGPEVNGAANQGASAVLAGDNEQIGILLQKSHAFEIIMGAKLLPILIELGQKVGDLVLKITAFAEKHPLFAKYVVTAAAITSGVLLLGGALALASAAMLGFTSYLPAMIAWGSWTGITTAATWAWAAAQWAVNER